MDNNMSILPASVVAQTADSGTFHNSLPTRSAGSPSAAADTSQPSAGKAAQESTHPTQADLQKALDRANEAVRTMASSELQFSVDKESGVPVVKITDKRTGELIRQVPSEEMIRIAESIDKMKGILIKQQA